MLLVVLLLLAGASGCPSATRPCACHEKSRGLDLSCELASAAEVRRAAAAVSDTGLWYLKLRNVRLAHFPRDLLAGLRVRHLIAHNCSVATADAFPPDLESLDLSHNLLQRVPSGALQGLAHLAALNLNYNRLEALHPEAFRGLVSLLRLSLYGNRIATVDDRAFEGVGGNLTHLNLGGNRLAALPPLHHMGVLQGLQLQENRIAVLDFRGMGEALDVLELAGNHLEELPDGAFDGLGLLNSLDLDNNRIRSIQERAFDALQDSLEWLKLGGNELRSVPSAALRRLSRLRQLDLRQNRILALHDDDFQGFGATLKFVYLQKNRLLSIEAKAFLPLDSLEWLYLHSNRLQWAPYDTFRSVLDTLHILDLHENPFTCDCRIAWLRDWVSVRNTTVLNLPMETRCSQPRHLEGRPLPAVTHLELGCAPGTAPRLATPLLSLLLMISFSMCCSLRRSIVV